MIFWKKGQTGSPSTPPLSDEEVAKTAEIVSAIRSIMNEHPPTLGVIGASGTGKSSTLNSLFGTNFATSGSIRGTTSISSKDINLEAVRGEAQSEKFILRVIDAPGLAEDIRLDDNYLKMYEQNLEKCDAILWVMTARNRAIALDQMYLGKLEKFWQKMLFGINQCELVDPMDWNFDTNMPSDAQMQNLDLIEKDRSEKIEYVIRRKPKIVSYSAHTHYRLINLFEFMIEHVDPERKWLFDSIRVATAEDWLRKARGLSEEEIKSILSN